MNGRKKSESVGANGKNGKQGWEKYFPRGETFQRGEVCWRTGQGGRTTPTEEEEMVHL